MGLVIDWIKFIEYNVLSAPYVRFWSTEMNLIALALFDHFLLA